MPIVHHVRPASLPSLTPARIAAAAERLRRKLHRAVFDIGLVFGPDSALASELNARITAMADAARFEQPALSATTARLLHDLAGLPRAVSRAHELLTWMLAAAQAIESESRDAADVAAHLAGLLGEVERINAALTDHRADPRGVERTNHERIANFLISPPMASPFSLSY